MHPICKVPDSKIQYSLGTMFPSYLRLSGCLDSFLLVPTCSPWSSRSCCRPRCTISFSSLQRLYYLKVLYCGSGASDNLVIVPFFFFFSPISLPCPANYPPVVSCTDSYSLLIMVAVSPALFVAVLSAPPPLAAGCPSLRFLAGVLVAAISKWQISWQND